MRRTVQTSAAVVCADYLCLRLACRERERKRVQQATEAYWLTRASDSKCAEPSETRPPSSVLITCDCGWRAEREREIERGERVQQAIVADWITKAHDSRCAEPFKSRPPSYVPLALICEEHTL
jgi:hypothetical protein